MQNERATGIWRSRAPMRIDLAVGWTDVPPFSAEIGGAVVNAAINRYAYATVRPLHRLKAIAHEMKAALLDGDVDAFSTLLQENWENQKRLDPAVTNPDMDALFDLALANGAAGGKATGAGGGACVLSCARPDQEHVLRNVLSARGVELLDFSFDFRGLQTWRAR